MPRIRSIKPTFWQDQRLSRMAALTRLVYLCLWSMADDDGRMEADAEAVYHFGFPREKQASIRGALDDLAASGRIVRYQGKDGSSLIAIPSWLKHQKIDRATPSTIEPPPVGESSTSPRESSRAIDEPSTSPRERSLGIGWDGKGGEGRGEEADPEPPPPSPSAPEPNPPEDDPDDDDPPAPAALLGERLHEPLALCAKVLDELEASGVESAWLEARIRAATPQGAWAWKKTTLAAWRTDHPRVPDDERHLPALPDSHGAKVEQLDADRQRAAKDLEEFQASGYTSRAAYVRDKALGKLKPPAQEPAA